MTTSTECFLIWGNYFSSTGVHGVKKSLRKQLSAAGWVAWCKWTDTWRRSVMDPESKSYIFSFLNTTNLPYAQMSLLLPHCYHIFYVLAQLETVLFKNNMVGKLLLCNNPLCCWKWMLNIYNPVQIYCYNFLNLILSNSTEQRANSSLAGQGILRFLWNTKSHLGVEWFVYWPGLIRSTPLYTGCSTCNGTLTTAHNPLLA
jgi:hypothetical protein